jgi:hypothetical protein
MQAFIGIKTTDKQHWIYKMFYFKTEKHG